MFQTHCYDSWLGGDARKSTFFMWSQLGGTFPAPLFLFLAGISLAMVTDKLRQKDVPPKQIAFTTIRRGAEILGLGLLFRLQEFVVAWGWSPWTDLFRVDVLNTIGLSMMLVGAFCWVILSLKAAFPQLSRTRLLLCITAAGVGLGISLLTPLLWTTWRPRGLPWPLESYINGVHNLGEPQPGLFPIFPWTAFAFMGLAAGFFLLSNWARERGAMTFAIVGIGGIALFYLARLLDAGPQIYPVYDFWHTSPSFFLMRVGMLLIIMAASYLWCRWRAGQLGFSPFVQLCQSSLLFYWVQGYVSGANFLLLNEYNNYVDMNGVEPGKILKLVFDFCKANPNDKPISAIDKFIRDAKKVEVSEKDAFNPWDQ
jgi:predicted acyltransferase